MKIDTSSPSFLLKGEITHTVDFPLSKGTPHDNEAIKKVKQIRALESDPESLTIDEPFIHPFGKLTLPLTGSGAGPVLQ
jgi:hypothetical protein